MLSRKLRQMGAWILAACLTFGAVQFPAVDVKAAKAENLARSATATASNTETGTSFTPDKAIDGDKTTGTSRWGTNRDIGTCWFQLAWQEAKPLKSFSITWQRRTVQNLVIETSDTGTDGSWTQVWSRDSNSSSLTEEITMQQAVTAKYVKFTMSNILGRDPDGILDADWANVSILELEAYEDVIPDGRSEAQKIIENITAPTIAAGDTEIAMPDVPSGVTVRFCADYEQIIGEDGTIYQPLEARTVKGFYEVTCPVSEDEEEGSTARTEEYTIAVPGQFTDGEDANAKPAVIPELQEWHGTSGTFIVDSLSKIVVGSSELNDVADIFAEDYKDITGMDIQVVSGTKDDVMTGDFYLDLTSEKKGLDKEGYTINLDNAAFVEAEQATGAYWATRTILQIIKNTNGSIPNGMIRDYPKYEVRAFSLDVGRKPITLDALYDFAKNMAWYKMNSFQVHLSDNLIFHEDYPTLEQAVEQSYAGFRLESGVQNPEQNNQTATSEDVYYTKDDFRTFIQDSRIIGVDIVPEFDMPAHALPFTRAFQQYMTKKPGGQHAYLIEEIDIANPEAREWAKDIWNDYFVGSDPVFDEDVTIHIGTDEYHGTDGQEGKELFRQFSDEMIEFVQGTGRTVRMWGSLSNKSGTTPVRSEGVQLNIWNTGYANPQDMYNMGFDLINTLEGPNYIVPAAGYYNDYINAGSIYSTWQPNVIGNLTASAADDQMLGACYAIWHDSVDTRANGISQYDSFDRFFKPLSAYAARLWGEAEDYMKGENRDYAAFSQVSSQIGTAPGTEIYGEVDYLTSTIASYEFDDTLEKDSSVNGNDLTGIKKNVEQVTTEDGKGLKLKGGESYAETPLNLVGSNAVLTMKVKMDADADGEQILCESKDEFGAYGAYTFKAVQKNTGKVGFSREGYDYSFNYTLPKNEWVTLQFCSGKDTVDLYVNGELVDNKHYGDDGELATTTKGNGTTIISKNNNPDIYFANHETTELSEKLAQTGITKVATMMVPIGRIGSKENSFKGELEFVAVTGTKELSMKSLKVPHSEMTAEACSEADPASKAIDDDESTFWHSNYNTDKEIKDGHHWFKVTLENPTVINKLTYLPRQNSTNGRIYEYSIEIEKADGTKTTVADHQTWANDTSLKSAEFDPIEAKVVKISIHDAGGDNNGIHGTIAELNLFKPLSFDADDLQEKLNEYKNEYIKEDYTELSWSILEAAFERAEAVLNYPDSTEEDYFYAYEQIQDAIEKLVPAVNVSTRDRLVKAVLNAEKQLENVEDYTAESLAELEAAVEAAQQVLDNENASEADLEKALEDLRKVVLVSKKDEKKKEIEEAVKLAEQQLADPDSYDAAYLEALEEALNEVRLLLKDKDATLEQLTDALEKLNSKMEISEEDEKRTEITKAVDEFESLLENAEDYTEESVKELQEAIKKAKEVLNNENATLAELTKAMEELEKVKLVKKEDAENEELEAKKKELRDAVTKANNDLKNANKYTAASVAKLKSAVSSAEKILNSDDATLEQIQAALKAIKDAKLVSVSVPPAVTKYTVKFVSNGGTAIASKQIEKGKKVAKPATPKRTGYTFVGWYTNSALTMPYDFNKAVTTNITLYAKWKSTTTVPAVPALGKTHVFNDVLYKVTLSNAANGTVTALKLNNKKAKTITIPPTVEIDGYNFKVTAINAKAFQKAGKLTGVVIGENVTNIGSKAFLNCKKLKNIKFMGSKAPKIGSKAFKGTASKNCKVVISKKMKKKDFNKLKNNLKKQGISKKASIKRK